MGLAIRYSLWCGKRIVLDDVRFFVEATRVRARELGFADAGRVQRAAERDEQTTRWVFAYQGGDGWKHFAAAHAKCGYVIEVWPGEGCESALFGLCRYPRRAPSLAGPVIVHRELWEFSATCTTQYACEHGWDHFLRCHKMILGLLELWRQFGVDVEVIDEGRYWDTHSEEELRDVLNQYHRLIAMCAGAMKDAAEASGSGLRVESPIFERPDFEHLEHEGWQDLPKLLSGQTPQSSRNAREHPSERRGIP